MKAPEDIRSAVRLRQLAFIMRISRALHAAAELDIAEALAGGSKSSGEIAAMVRAEHGAVRRLLRALVAHGVFVEEAPDRFGLNAAGNLLRSKTADSQRAGVLFTTDERAWALWSDFLECVRTGRATTERAASANVFELNAQVAAQSAAFDAAMASFSTAVAAAAIAAYDFSGFRRIADIGGGSGRLLAQILREVSDATGMLFDLPHVVANAPTVLGTAGVCARCEIVAGSFFDRVPAGADAYLLKSILHDWDDERAIKILVRCREAMAPQAKLVILERVLPETAQAGVDADTYLLDLEMLVMAPGGRERTEAEFRAILAAAGFDLARLVPTASPSFVIEAAPT